MYTYCAGRIFTIYYVREKNKCRKYVWSKLTCIIFFCEKEAKLKLCIIRVVYMLACSWKIAQKDAFQGGNINYTQGCLETTNCPFVFFSLLQLGRFH